MITLPLSTLELGMELFIDPSGKSTRLSGVNVDLTIMPVNDHVELKIESAKHNLSIEWTEDEALMVASAILSQLYYLRGKK